MALSLEDSLVLRFIFSLIPGLALLLVLCLIFGSRFGFADIFVHRVALVVVLGPERSLAYRLVFSVILGLTPGVVLGFTLGVILGDALILVLGFALGFKGLGALCVVLSYALFLENCVADVFAGTGSGSSIPVVDSSCRCRVVVDLNNSPSRCLVVVDLNDSPSWCVVVVGASSNIGNMVMVVVVMLVATGTIRSRGSQSSTNK